MLLAIKFVDLFGWNTLNISYTMVSNHEQAITFLISDLKDDHSFFLTIIYGMIRPEERIPLWNHLLSLKSLVLLEPWALVGVGDFNTIRDPCTRLGNRDFDYNGIAEFNNCSIQLSVSIIRGVI
ncbi:hypothetical protein ACH5RR_008555 [Cinchona calisaya]|uniref:Endonuclease/exonuclease/phosphatase domain-containing protein n=1 Tax=Cinchona calisaya TaxID=153742 RepID=A0ABD3AHE2_9GENT